MLDRNGTGVLDVKSLIKCVWVFLFSECSFSIRGPHFRGIWPSILGTLLFLHFPLPSPDLLFGPAWFGPATHFIDGITFFFSFSTLHLNSNMHMVKKKIQQATQRFKIHPYPNSTILILWCHFNIMLEYEEINDTSTSICHT